MKKKIKPLPHRLLAWMKVRKKFHLSDTHVQMARELGLNPYKLGKIANHKQEPWKLPLPLFIETLYRSQFSKSQPDEVKTLREIARTHQDKQLQKNMAKQKMNRMISTL